MLGTIAGNKIEPLISKGTLIICLKESVNVDSANWKE
jgi:hypothetical protein